MSKYIKEQVTIELKDRIKDVDAENTFIDKLYELFFDVEENCIEIAVIKDGTAVDIQIDANVHFGYHTKEVMDEFHNSATNIKAILIIDADCHFGGYSYLKTDKTSVDDAECLLRNFIDGIKDNIEESTNNINW